tara:strand:+ start:8210 stop:8674 length:465 start_codon:yes stop_codon:yes gene_type:complete
MLKKFLIDVDGVLTTGQFLYSEEGKIFKIFGPHDSDGLKLIKQDIDISFISADKRGFEISKKRVEDMGFNLVYCSEQDRKNFITENYNFKDLAYMGDGIFDVDILKEAALGICPNNARPEAMEVADFVTPSKSAEGSVLDACLYIKKNYLDEVN